ncbi:Neurofibromin 1 [Balamuthia mandrillaris]
MTFLSSVKELAKVIPEKELGIPPSTVAVEKDVKATFSPVQKIMQYTNQKEVIIRISNNLFAVITTKQHCIFDKRVAMVDLYHISNIREINLSPDDNELIIKYDTKSQKTNLTFKCENANRIILALKASKARWDLSKPDTLHTSKRSFRASEVPGTLLNMALLNLGNPNAVLRVEAYNLLTALCSSRLSAPIALWETAGLCIPRNTTNFTVTLSQRLAQTEPDITLEFLMEALHGMEKIKENLPGKQLCLSYMSHWISNLRLFCAPTNQPDSTVKIEKTTQIIKSFIEFTIKEAGITGPAIQEKIWEVFGNVPEILDLTIDCLLERAEQKKQGTALSVIGDMFVSMASCSPGLVAGKVIARLMKVLDSSKNGPVSRLDEHALWKKIVVLLRVLLMLSFSNLLHVQQFLPELLFSILLLFSTGPSFVRATVHGLFINVVQSLYTALLSPDNKLQPLRLLLSELNRQEMRVLFGLGGSPVSPFSKPSDDSESLSSAAPLSITTVETVATKLFSVLGACSADDSPWHARLLSLTTRTAYTPNPALQPRAIIALGVLCNTSSLVTDDLIYQVLRTLRDVLGTPGQRLDHDLPLSLVICLTRLLEHLSPSSRFFKPMFWVAIILLEIDDCKLFGVAIGLLEAVLKTMDLHECLDDGITSYCLACREECGLEAILTKADQVTGISFKTSFSFAVSAHLLKGLRTPATKTATARVLSTFVDIAAKKGLGTNVLGYLAALLPVKGDDMDHLRNLLLPSGEAGSPHQYLFTEQMLPDTMNAALLFTLLVTILKSSDSEHEQLFIYESLKEGVLTMPEAFPVVYDILLPKMAQVIQNSQNEQIIDACLSIMKSIFSSGMESTVSKKRLPSKDYLAQKVGFHGLVDADSFTKPVPKTDALVKIACNVLDQIFTLCGPRN